MLAQTDIIQRLGGGGQAGRAVAAENALEQIKAEGSLVQKPFVPKKRTFAFPNPERMGQRVLEIVGLTHGYGDRRLFDDVSLEMEKGERVALIGERPISVRLICILDAGGACCGSSAWDAICGGYCGQGRCVQAYARHRPDALTVSQWRSCCAAGPNGCGKSTLLRLVMGREKAIAGSVSLGQHHILPNYFEQNQASPCAENTR